MTILNKIREKYRKERSPLNAINYKSHRLIKLPTANKSVSFINLDQANQEKIEIYHQLKINQQCLMIKI